MMINRINNIDYRIFKNFSWPRDMCDFRKKNLIYGWNGSGKSTLADILRCIEKGIPIRDVKFTIENNRIDGKELSDNTTLPQIRVFNRAFVSDNIFTSDGLAAPIVFLGEGNIIKQKEINKLSDDLNKTQSECKEKIKKKSRKEKELNDFTVERAAHIKALLSSAGKNSYNSYDKRNFERKCDDLLKLLNEKESKVLSKSEFNDLKIKIEGGKKNILSAVNIALPDMKKLGNKVQEILKKTVLSNIIESLNDDFSLSEWVKKGLEKHKKDSVLDCLFCEQSLPHDRLEKLELHFNDQYNSFMLEIKSLYNSISQTIEDLLLSKNKIPDEHRLYDDLRVKYKCEVDNISRNLSEVMACLEKYKNLLNEKREQPFNAIEEILDAEPCSTDIISKINLIISQHNDKTNNFKKSIDDARSDIEISEVVKILEKYNGKRDEIVQLKKDVNEKNAIVEKLKGKIKSINNDIKDHRTPVNELNEDIAAYLGRNELIFKIKDSGYQIFRDNMVADNLCEGEKTAIAFLYFLKSLEDVSFSLEKGIVVIDDPISSLDSNAIYCAYGFMKEKTKNAGQLFILTHNFTFFQQVKKWFSYCKKKERAFYMLEAQSNSDSIYSNIKSLDPFLEQYESEYQYLYSIVYKNSKRDERDLCNFHQMPNIARRLLENFLAFKQPQYNSSDPLWKKMENINFDEAKKARVLRFANTLSHSRYVEDQPCNDLSSLSESAEILSDLLSLMESSDSEHCQAMKQKIEEKIKVS